MTEINTQRAPGRAPARNELDDLVEAAFAHPGEWVSVAASVAVTPIYQRVAQRVAEITVRSESDGARAYIRVRASADD